FSMAVIAHFKNPMKRVQERREIDPLLKLQ
ncbi:MAG: hypothetical protein ACI8RD_003860, partial [Bacillariaceae sp.]